MMTTIMPMVEVMGPDRKLWFTDCGLKMTREKLQTSARPKEDSKDFIAQFQYNLVDTNSLVNSQQWVAR